MEITRIGLHCRDRTKANTIHVSSNVNPKEVLDGLGINMNDSDLTADQKHELAEFCLKTEAFAKYTSELGTTDLHVHRIDTGYAKPVHQRFYRTSPKHKATHTLTYDKLTARLDMRFGPGDQAERLISELRSRTRRAKESLQELGQSVRQLTALAFPELPQDSQK